MKIKNLLFLFITGLILNLAWLSAQETTTFTSSVVAEISEAAPDADQDDADLMIQSVSGGSYQSLIMFDISTLSKEIGYAAVKFYMAQHEEKSGAGLITPYRVMLLPVENTDWDGALTWNMAQSSGLVAKDPYALAYIDVMDYNKPYSSGKDSKWYNVANALVTNHINSKIADGASKVAFALVAMDSVPEHNVWAGGTWRSPELTVMSGVAPTVVGATDVAELFEATPDMATADGGDLMIKKTTDGNDIISLLKFDLTGITNTVTNASIQVYGAQHEADMMPIDKYLIEMYEVNNHSWDGASVTYNTFNNNFGHADVGTAVFDMNNPNSAGALRGFKSKIISNIRLAELINSYINDGKTEISFAFKAGTTNDDFDAWFGGTWRGPQLYLEHGKAPFTFTATGDAEVSSVQPDVVNPDGSAGDLKIQTNASGEVIRSYVKFDLTGLSSADIRNATIQVYGAQNEPNPESVPERYLVDIFGVDDVDLIDFTSLTYNISEGFTRSEKALGRVDMPANAVPNKVYKYKFFDQQALTDYIKAKLDAGSSTVGFVLSANDSIDSHDAYIGGVAWKAPELKIISSTIFNMPVLMDTVVGQSLMPLEDSWVEEANQFANHNGEADMNITKITGNNREAYIKFDISGSSEADIVSLDVIGAQKNDDTWTAIENFYVDVYGATDNTWAEAGLQWANKPSTSTDILATVNVNVTNSITFSFTGTAITDYVNSQIAAGNDYITFVLKGKDETAGSRAWFSSKDWKTPKMNLLYFATDSVASPVIEPVPGLYAPNANLSVSITTATNNAKIYYTKDGSVPTSSSTLYEGAFDVTGADGESVTLRAVSILDTLRSHLTEAVYLFGTQQPYGGADPWAIPGVVMGWKYDLGGEGVAYHEAKAEVEEGCGDNQQTLFSARGDEGLLDGCYETATDKGTIGWAENGEWAEYTVNVAEEGCFTVELKYLKATNEYPGSVLITEVDENGNTVQILVDTTSLFMNTDTENDWGADAFALPSHNFDTSFTLTAGEHVVRITWIENNWNLAQLEFHPSTDCVTGVDNKLISRARLFPNPTSDILNLEMQSLESNVLNFSIVDISGRKVQSENQSLYTGINTIRFDVSQLETGIYFIIYEVNNQTGVKRFSKTK